MSTDVITEKPLFELKLLENAAVASLENPVRSQALDVFRQKGLPGKKHEDWRYTDLTPVLKKDWILETVEGSITAADIKKYIIPGLAVNRMVFVNGIFSDELSSISETDESIIISPFSLAAGEYLNRHFGSYASANTSGFAALNTAAAAEGLFVYIPDGVKLSAPVHAMYFHTGDSPFIQYRNLIIAGKNAEAGIIEGTYALSGSAFSNIVSEIVAEEGARLNYYKLQSENDASVQINYTQFYQHRNSLCNSFTINISGKLLRNDLNYTLADRDCESHLYGLYIPSGEEHHDNHTFVDHAMPGCFSNEIYKGIMSGRSTAVFNGKILVRQDAQKTNAYQSNKNVLLSADAKVDTKPQLEIFADDVKCSHGATVGQLDDEAIFYMRSRGIDEHAARTMLTFAFAEETLDNIDLPPLKSYLADLIEQKLSLNL